MKKIYRLENKENGLNTITSFENEVDVETVKAFAEFGIEVTGGWESGNVPFEVLPTEVKEDVLRTLKAYDSCDVVHENGEFKVGCGCCVKKHYATDHFVCGDYKADELYTPEEREKNFLEVFGYKRSFK